MSGDAPSPSEERRWGALGAGEPYWAVCTEDRFRAGRMSDADRSDFFASGEGEVRETLGFIVRHLVPQFRPAISLDYGCGVGRLTLPIARASGRAIGVDISESMLREARANAQAQGVTNVVFQRPGEALALHTQDLDFVHSYIVFQHIEPATGLAITRRLLARLRPGGVGALHYTYARRASIARRVVHRLRRRVPGVNALVNLVQGRPASEPMIPVYEYDLESVLALIRGQGCQTAHLRLTDHGGHLGAMFVFVRPG